jgi:hypothetical protein
MSQEEGGVYSLKQCIDAKVCTCFHRSVFYNTLMGRAGIDCVTLNGNVVETEMEKIDEDPKLAPIIYNARVSEEDFVDSHLWNVVMQDNKYYLVDSSFLIDDKPVIQEIEFDNEKRNTFTIKLPNGKYRHYLSLGTINVEQIE